MVSVEFTKGGGKAAREFIPTLLKVGAIAIDELINPSLTAKITVSFKKLPKNTHALVEPLKTCGSFRISLNKDASFQIMALFLCHEIVHIKQFLNGELKLSSDKTKATWNSNDSVCTYDSSQIGNGMCDAEFEQYKQLPWENEAYSKADELMAICKDKLKNERLDLGAGLLIPLF